MNMGNALNRFEAHEASKPGVERISQSQLVLGPRDPSAFSEGDWRHCYGLEMFGGSKYLLRSSEKVLGSLVWVSVQFCFHTHIALIAVHLCIHGCSGVKGFDQAELPDPETLLQRRLPCG